MPILILRSVFTFTLAVGAASAAQHVVLYSFGPSASATVRAMVVDKQGNVYLAGLTTSQSFPATPGSVQPQYGGDCMVEEPLTGLQPQFNPDAFVMKLDSAGKVLFATFLGGTGPEEADSIAVDSLGYIYVAGTIAGPALCGGNIFPTTPKAAFRQPISDVPNGFVAKLSPAGDRLIYSTYLPAAQAKALALDRAGNVYVAGSAVLLQANPLITPGSFQTSIPNVPGSPAVTTGYVGKLNADGSALVYGSYLGGAPSSKYENVVNGIEVDASGNAYVTGATTSAQFPITAGSFQTQLPGLQSAFAAKIDPAGASLVYSTFLGGTDSTQSIGNVIQIDAQGNAYVLGTTSSAAFPVTAGAFQPMGQSAPWAAEGRLPSLSVGFLTKLNPQGTALVYSTYLSGALGVAVDGAGNAYVEGAAYDGFPVTPGASQPCTSSTILALQPDSFAIQFNAGGKVVGATYVEGSPEAITVDPQGSVYTVSFVLNPETLGATSVVRMQIDDPHRRNGPCLSPAVQNGVTFLYGAQQVAPGQIVTLRGTAFGPIQAAHEAIGSDGKVTTKLSGVQVFFDEIPAPILYAQSTQINTIAPWEIAGKSSTKIHVEYNGVSTSATTVPVVPAVPALFFEDLSTGVAAALNQDQSVNSPTNPAKRGSVVSLFGTGGGLMSPGGVTGGFWPAHPLSKLALPVQIQICGERASVLYAGAAPGQVSGVFQINFRVPEDRPPSVPMSTSTCGGLFVLVGSAVSSVSADIYVQF